MNPYEPGDELDRVDPTLDEVARRVESYARRSGGEPPADLVSRITAVLADEPIPVGRWAWLGPWREPLRAVAAVVVLAAIIGGALLAGTLIDRARNVGSSPTPAVPSVSASPSIPPTPTPTVSPSSLVTPQPTISVTPLPTVSPVTPFPSPDDDDDEIETPTPSPTDHDNSGPGGGGGSGSSGSGSGSGSGGSGSGSDD
jgi:uncharacterized membrane protein YgcG